VQHEGHSLDSLHELGDNRHLGLRVNSLTGAEEVLSSESVRVEITAILVAVAVVARFARTAGGVASARAVGRARVGSEGSRNRVLREMVSKSTGVRLTRALLTASQISISAQHEPLFPVPELGSPLAGVHPSTFACTVGQLEA